MHRIPKNSSQIYSEQFVSGAEEASSSSGSKRRAESSSSLVSSPLANKRKRGDATQGGGKRRSLGPFNLQKGAVQTVQGEVAPDHGWGVEIGTIDNLEKVINSLLYPEPPPQVFSPPIDFGTHPEVSNAPNEESICLDLSEYLINDDEDDQPESLDTEMTMGSQGTELSDILCANLSITELLKPSSDFGDPENVSQDCSLDFLDEWTAYDENSVSGNQNAEMNLRGEPEVNHAALPVNDVQAVEENTNLKRKRGRPTSWTPKLEEMASNIVQANADRELDARKLHHLLEAKCDAQVPKLACPSYESFRLKFLEKSHETYVKWTPELKEMASNIVQANANRKLSKLKQYDLLTKECGAHKPTLACPSYESFRINFLKKGYGSQVLWTDKFRSIANAVIAKYSSLGYKKQYEKFEVECKAKGLLEIPKISSFFNLKQRSMANKQIE